MRTWLVGCGLLSLCVVLGCPATQEGTRENSRGSAGENESMGAHREVRHSASSQGLDPNKKREVFGSDLESEVPGRSSLGQRPADPPPKPSPEVATPTAAKQPSSFAESSPVGGAPIEIEIEFEEGVYPYQGEHLGQSDGVDVQASSTLCNGPRCYDAKRLLDRDDATAWCEGSDGKGVGQWVLLDLGRARSVTQISFSPGYAKDRKRWIQNARPRVVEIVTDNERFRAEFPRQTHVFSGESQMDFMVPILDFPLRLKKVIRTQMIRVEIKSVWPGTRYEDMCLSEIAVYGR